MKTKTEILINIFENHSNRDICSIVGEGGSCKLSFDGLLCGECPFSKENSSKTLKELKGALPEIKTRKLITGN